MRLVSVIRTLAIVSLYASATFAAIPQSERDALVALYDSTGGPSWSESSGWLGAAGTECSWFGITCDSTESHVTSIWMQSNGLAGTLPGEISQLTELETLDIFDARLSGTVPASIATMTKLERLNLGTMRFFEEGGLSGEIPAFLLGMTQLRYLSLEGNDFSGSIPAGISQLVNLESLRLGYNDLTGDFPAEITSMTELVDLDISSNRITGTIPETIGNLKKLESFTIQFNQMSGTLPNALGELTNLIGFVIQGNDFHGTIPESIGNLPNLGAVFIGVTNLEGPIPSGIWNNPNVYSFYPYRMPYLTGGIPSDIGNMTNLHFFVATGTPFGGQLPAEIGKLDNLITLMVAGCNLEGPIPPEIGDMQSLQLLRMQFNRFSGSIPPELGNAPSLRIAQFHGNQLTGPIPAELGNLPSIETLDLGSNLLEGTIPPELAGLATLRQLGLHGNRLAGAIPPEFNSNISLRELAISGNRFEGTVPASILGLQINDGGGGFGHNALRTDDTAIDEFLARKQNGGDWQSSQAKPPTDVTADDVRSFSVLLRWDEVEPLGVPGGYQVLASTSPGGPYSLLRTTPNRYETSQLVTGLTPDSDYYFVVRSVIYPHTFYDGTLAGGPDFIQVSGLQPNTLFSEPSPEIYVRTPAGTPTPAAVVMSAVPGGLAQLPGVGGATTTFTLSNLGGTSTNVTLSSSSTLFDFAPKTFALAPGGDQVVTVTGLPQPEGFYSGEIDVDGEGVPPFLRVFVNLASIDEPGVGYLLKAGANRIDVSAPAGNDPSGSVTFRNDGSGTFSGFLVADVDWLESASGLVTIAPGESVNVPFSVDRSKRPDADQLAGAAAGGLRMLTVSGTSAKNAFDGPPSAAAAVSVVDTVKPPTSEGSIPPLGSGEVAIFVPGVGHAVGSVGLFISDISILNSFASRSVNDIRLFYRELSGATTKNASLDPLAVSGSVGLADVVSTVFEGTSEVGTLQIRTTAIDSLAVSANIFNASKAAGTYGTAIPVFRSDRATGTGGAVFLTGLQSGETSHTNIYVQETRGFEVTFTVEIFDETGETIGSLGGSVQPFGMTRLLTSVPAGGVAARIAPTGGSGAIVAYATPVDRRSGDTWAVSDWASQFSYEKDEPVLIPVAGSVRGANETFFRTELAITSLGCYPTRGLLHYYEDTGASYQKEVVLDAGATALFDDVVGSFGISGRSLGYLTFTPLPLVLDPPDPVPACNEARFALASRTFATVGDDPGTYGTGVPVLSLASAIRAGQQRKIGGLDDSRASTVSARTPATFRTNFALIEASGEPIKVRARVLVSDPKSLASGASLGEKDYDLAAHQSLQVSGLVGAILGPERDTRYGDLRNVQVEFRVLSGDGSLIVYTSSIDNGTGDSSLRVE
jgi:hypothetical protein